MKKEQEKRIVPPLVVAECPLHDIKETIERVHYSRSVFGVTITHCYSVSLFGKICGGAIFGKPGAYNVSRRYAYPWEELLELRRFVLEDFLPRNSESKAIAAMLRDLKKKGVNKILSYADPAHGHSGIIYAATGFAKIGVTAKRKHLVWKGKKYPDRNLHQVNFPFHAELRAAVQSGEAVKIAVPGKIIWLKRL